MKLRVSLACMTYALYQNMNIKVLYYIDQKQSLSVAWSKGSKFEGEYFEQLEENFSFLNFRTTFLKNNL